MQEGVLPRVARPEGLGGIINIFLQDAVHLSSHVVEDETKALWHEPEVCCLAPNEKEEACVQKLALVIHLVLTLWEP